MGVVYAAYDEQLDRKVALKLVRNAGQGPAGQRERILREAQAMARISHPNVVHIYEVGEHEGAIFIAMEFIEGTTLASWQRQPARTWSEVLTMYLRAGQGLLAAHQAGLVHRDFKPENVLIGNDGRVKVADFGIARGLKYESIESAPAIAPEFAAAERSRISGERSPLAMSLGTSGGLIVGTPGYMSPEQYAGLPTDVRSDQFSFCASLYEALYHRLPFAGENLAEVAANVLAGKLQPAPENSAVPLGIRDALLRGLSREPEERFPALTEIMEELAKNPDFDPRNAHAAQWRLAMAIAMTAALLVGVTYLSWTRGRFSLYSLLVNSSALLVVVSSVAFVLRRTLMRNVYYRGMVTIFLCTLATMVFVRTLALQRGFSLAQFAPIDLGMIAGFVAIIGALYLRGALLISLGLVGAALWFTRSPETTVRYMPFVQPLAFGSLMYLSYNYRSKLRAARKGPAEEPAGVPPT